MINAFYFSFDWKRTKYGSSQLTTETPQVIPASCSPIPEKSALNAPGAFGYSLGSLQITSKVSPSPEYCNVLPFGPTPETRDMTPDL